MKMKPLANVDWRKYFSLNNTTLNEYLYNYGDDFLTQSLFLLIDAHRRNTSSIVLIEFTNIDIVSVVEIVKYEKTIKPKRTNPSKKSHKITIIN